MRNSIINAGVRAVLAQANPDAEGNQVVLDDGTVVSESIRNEAIELIHQAYDIHQKVVALSRGILKIAQECVESTVKDKKPNLTLALARFKAAIAAAEAKLAQEAAEQGQEEEARVKAFVSESSWAAYTSNIRAGMEKGFDPREVTTESAYRAKIKAAADMSRTVSQAKRRLSDLDLSKVQDRDISDAIEANTDNDGQINWDGVKKDLVEVGAVQKELTEEELKKQADAVAMEWIPTGTGDEENPMIPAQQALSEVLRLCYALDWSVDEDSDYADATLRRAARTLREIVNGEKEETEDKPTRIINRPAAGDENRLQVGP